MKVVLLFGWIHIHGDEPASPLTNKYNLTTYQVSDMEIDSQMVFKAIASSGEGIREADDHGQSGAGSCPELQSCVATKQFWYIW